ncbi:hypothetical protein BGX28_000329 [Mortierella sp. GBA30]|nr:hypothetical protein BGX28_000329 [Mortierella sp. GBA30]
MEGLNKAKKRATIDIQFSGEDHPPAMSILELDQSISPIKCSVPDGEAQDMSWRHLGESIVSQVVSMFQVQEPLRSFYTSSLFKIKSRLRKTARKATLNKSVDRVISASGLSEKWVPGKGPRPVFVVGDGQFGASKGPVLHQQFITLLKKAKTKGIIKIGGRE